MNKAEEDEFSCITSSLFIYVCVVRGGLHLIPTAVQPLPDNQIVRQQRGNTQKAEFDELHTHTHAHVPCRGAVRTLVDIIRPDTFLSRFQIRRVCILLNADSVSLFLFPPTQPHSLYLFVLLTCLIPETPRLIRAVQTALCTGVGGNTDPNKKKKKRKKQKRERM